MYASALGPEKFGRIEQLLALSLLLVPVLSMQAYEAFLTSYSKDAVQATSSAVTIILAGSGIAAVLCVLVVCLFPADRLVSIYFTILVVSTMAWQFFRNTLRVKQAWGELVKCEVIQAMASLATGCLLLKAGFGISGALLAIAAGNIIASVLVLVSTSGPRMILRYASVSESSIRKMLAISGRLVPNVVLWWGIELSDRLLLAHFLGDAAVGLYSAGVRVASMLMALSLLLYQAWQIRAIHALNENSSDFFKVTFKWYVLAISVCASMLIVALAPLSRLLFGEQYSNSLLYSSVLIPAFLLAAICYFFGIIYYSADRKQSALKASLSGLVVSVGINIIFIPILGIIAAAWATFFAYLVMASIRYFEIKSTLGKFIRWSGLVLPFGIITLQSIAFYMGAKPPVLAIGAAVIIIASHKDIIMMLGSLKDTISRTSGHP